MTTKLLLFIGSAFATTASSNAITSYALEYGRGLSKGMQIAADYVDSSAPDWATDYMNKSDAEFQLLAMKQTYAISSFGNPKYGPNYVAGISDGIQEYIEQMNSVGDPVWFTGSTAVTVPTSPSARVTPPSQARALRGLADGHRPAL